MSRIKVNAFEDARELTLKKWEDILKKLERLGEGVECGFCSYSNYLTLKHMNEDEITERCFYCPVELRCIEIQQDTGHSLHCYMENIRQLIKYLTVLNEKDTTSKYLESKKIGGE